VLCSTAPLSEDIALRIEEMGGASVVEIYGSTETGAIATRRTARTQAFSLVNGIELFICDGQAVARGGHLCAQIPLNDLLLDIGRKLYCSGPYGRRGKLPAHETRSALTAELNRAPGVIDGALVADPQAAKRG
jgi:hypothetical protein